MDFALTDEQGRIQETVRDFGEREVRPHAAAWDRDEAFPHAAVTQLATLGLLGLGLPRDVGGGGADALACALVIERVARYDASLGLTVASHAGLASGHIGLFASDTPRRRSLPRLARGEWLGAWCLTQAGPGGGAGGAPAPARRGAGRLGPHRAQKVITHGAR